MTGSTQALVAGGTRSLFGITVASVHHLGVSGTITVTILASTDGTWQADISQTGNWFLPTTVGVGTSWWIRATLVSPLNTTTGGSAFGTWLQLNAVRSWGFTNSAPALTATGSVTFDWSPDAGATISLTTTSTYAAGF